MVGAVNRKTSFEVGCSDGLLDELRNGDRVAENLLKTVEGLGSFVESPSSGMVSDVPVGRFFGVGNNGKELVLRRVVFVAGVFII